MARQVDPSLVFEAFACRRASVGITLGGDINATAPPDRFTSLRSQHRILEEGHKALSPSVAVKDIGELQAKQLVELERRWSEYYKQKRIEECVLFALEQVVRQKELPENPFIQLCNRVRYNEIRSSLLEEKRERAHVDLVNEVGVVEEDSGVACVRGEREVFGLPHCLRLVDACASASVLDYLLNVDHVMSSFAEEQPEYQVRVVTALTGSVVFAGKVMPFLPEHVDLSTDVTVDGKKLENAIKLFANAVIRNSYQLESSPEVIFYGIKIMPAKSSRYIRRESTERTKTWTTSKIRAAKASFVSAVKAATVGKRSIYLDFVVRSTGLKLQSIRYVSVRKYFTFHFRHKRTAKATEFSSVQSFCDHPLSALYLGYYHIQDDAIFYASLFKSKPRSAEAPSGKIVLDSKDKRLVAFKNDLKVALSKAFIEGEILLTVELLLCLCVFNLAGTVDVWSGIISFMWSTAGRLRSSIRQNTTLQRVVEDLLTMESLDGRNGRGRRSKLLQHQELFESFASYRKHLLDLAFAHNSSEMDALSKLIRHELYDMTNHVSRQLVLNSKTVARFQEIQYLSEALESTIARDVFQILNEKSPEQSEKLTIRDMVDLVLEQVEALSSSSSARMSKGQGGELREVARAAMNELRAAERSRNTQLIVNVEEEAKRNVKRKGFPLEIAKQGTVLQYIGDARIDLCLKGIIVDLLLNGKLLPNPFPHIVELLSAEAARHSLWRESDSELRSLMNWSPLHAVLSHPRDYIFKANKKNRSGVDDEPFSLHGSKAAVILCHERSLVELLFYFQQVFCSLFQPVFKDKRARYNSFEISINIAIGGEALLFSRLYRLPSPLATLGRFGSFTFYEQFVFKGGSLDAAVETFAEIVIVHTVHTHEKSENVLLAICTGKEAFDMLNRDPGNDGGWRVQEDTTTNDAFNVSKAPPYGMGMRMSVHFLHREHEGAMRELVRAAKACEPIVVVFGMHVAGASADPFYVTVHKQMGFFFVDDRTGQVVSLLPEYLRYDSLYKGVWLDGKQAALASKASRTSDADRTSTSDPDSKESRSFKVIQRSLQEKAGNAYGKGQIFCACKSLLRLALLQGNTQDLADLVRIFKLDSLCQELSSLISLTDCLCILLAERSQHEELRIKMSRKTLQEQLARYCTQVEDVLARADCFYFHGIRNSIHGLLHKAQSVLQGDRTGKSTLHSDYLAEIRVYLVCIQISASQAVFRNCPSLEDQCVTFSRKHR